MRVGRPQAHTGPHGAFPAVLHPPGRPVHASYARTLLHRLGDSAGVEKRVHPHAFRHSMAWESMWKGVPVPVIQRQLGHASLATTVLLGSLRTEGPRRGDAAARD